MTVVQIRFIKPENVASKGDRSIGCAARRTARKFAACIKSMRRNAFRRLAHSVPQRHAARLPRLEALGWEAVPIAEALGAEIRGADLTKLTSTEFDAIREALLEYEVVFFREQHGFSPADHAALANYFGPVQTHPAYPHVNGYPELTILENDRERPSLIEKWHTDMTFRPCPPMGSILHGLIVPPDGKGDTEFLSMAAAFAELEPSLKERLATLEAEHSFEHGFKESLAQPGGRERLKQALLDNPPVIHPVVRTHPESGRSSLFVNGLFTTKILGMADAESAELLAYLQAFMEDMRFRCRFRWRPDSVAIWDNRITQHRPVNDYWPEHRKLQRITIDGDRPFYESPAEPLAASA